MTNESSILLEEFQSEFKNYKNYLDSNDWHDDVYTNYKTGKIESPKLDTEVSIISTILKSITKFKEDVGEDYDKKPIQSFIKFTSEKISFEQGGIRVRGGIPLGLVCVNHQDKSIVV